jgi:hypothetical protein
LYVSECPQSWHSLTILTLVFCFLHLLHVGFVGVGRRLKKVSSIVAAINNITHIVSITFIFGNSTMTKTIGINNTANISMIVFRAIFHPPFGWSSWM